MTRYKVFRKLTLSDGDSFEPIDTVEAHDAKAAISDAITGLDEDAQRAAHGATFAAVPERSWTEASPEVQLELKVRVR